MRPERTQSRRWICGSLLALVALAGCRQEMADQPRYDPFEPSRYFEDGQSARAPVAGTVARGGLQQDPHFYTGVTRADADIGSEPSLERTTDYADSFPSTVTRGMMARGRERFTIFCAPCHAQDGIGPGIVIQHGYPKPAPLHTDRLSQAPPGYIFDVITRGYSDTMPPFRGIMTTEDRWAIVAYLRAMQWVKAWEPNTAVPALEQVQAIAEELPVCERGERTRIAVPTGAGSGRSVQPLPAQSNSDLSR